MATGFNQYVTKNLKEIRAFFDEPKNGETIVNNFHNPSLSRVRQVFSLGLYSLLVKRWLAAFNLGKNLMIVDGEELLSNPGAVVEQVQDFMGVPRILQSDDFVRNPVSGLYCIRPWWKRDYDYRAEKLSLPTWEDNLQCLVENKGRSRSKNALFSMSIETKAIIQNFYRPYNEQLFKLINKRFNW